jgi:DNA polymerase III alpha subunit (gram-positive type)
MQQSLFGNLLAPSESETETQLKDILKTPLADAIFTVIDVETTGLSAKKNSLTEVTAIQFKNGQEVGKYSTLVKPLEEIPFEVETITGINNDMVANAPPLITVISELCQFVGTIPVIVGHNVGFDIRFISEKIQQCNLLSYAPCFDINRAVCTKALATKALPGLPSYEGIVVATTCGVYNPNPHRAENDVRMSAGILFSIIGKLQGENPSIKTLQDLLDYQGPL